MAEKKVINLETALINIAEIAALEEGVLQDFMRIKDHFDKELAAIHQQNEQQKEQKKAQEKVAAKDAMITEANRTTADPLLEVGIDALGNDLASKNIQIAKLQQMLEEFGLESTASGQSKEMMQQQLDQLLKRARERNSELREFQRNLQKAYLSMVSKFGNNSPPRLKENLNQLLGESASQSVSSQSVTIKNGRAFLRELEKQINVLNQENVLFKQQIKSGLDKNPNELRNQSEVTKSKMDQKTNDTPDTSVESTRRRPR